MEWDLAEYDIDPHEYFGLVYDLPAAKIPETIAKEAARRGFLLVSNHQSFVHHKHVGGYPTFDEPELETLVALRWEETLSLRFPDKKFIIEIQPQHLITWYQLTSQALLEDEDWEEQNGSMHIDQTDSTGLLIKLPEELKPATEWKRSNPFGRYCVTSRQGNVGICDKCRKPLNNCPIRDHQFHRGIRYMECPHCQARMVHSTRTIRTKVGF